MYATNHFEEIMLNLARGISASAPETMYLALYLNDPGDDGAGTEVSYSGYARQPITFSAPAASGNGYAMQNTARTHLCRIIRIRWQRHLCRYNGFAHGR